MISKVSICVPKGDSVQEFLNELKGYNIVFRYPEVKVRTTVDYVVFDCFSDKGAKIHKDSLDSLLLNNKYQNIKGKTETILR